MSAILFLLILVFNFYGYRLVIAYMEKKGSTAIEQKLDKQDYGDDELISIKTVLNLPYYSSSPHFERVYGSATVNGIVYEYVKKRVYKDTLELLCLPNESGTKLQDIRNNLAQAAADGEVSFPVKKGGTSTLKLSLPDFFQPVPAIVFWLPQPEKNIGHHLHLMALATFSQQPERPPQHPSVIS